MFYFYVNLVRVDFQNVFKINVLLSIFAIYRRFM